MTSKSLLSNWALTLIRKFCVYVVNKILQLTFMADQRLRIPNFNSQSTEIDLREPQRRRIQANFSGTSLMYHLVESDWLLYSSQIYEKKVVIIGGFHGVATRRILNDIPKVEQIHVYEPVYEFSRMQPENPKVTTYVQAIWTKEQDLDICLEGDFSFIPETGRGEYVEHKDNTIRVDATTWQQAAERIGNNPITLFMNAEGSEYPILLDILKNGKNLPSQIIFQSHQVGEFPYKTLFNLRSKLADFYEPVICFDFAWDVWVLS